MTAQTVARLQRGLLTGVAALAMVLAPVSASALNIVTNGNFAGCVDLTCAPWSLVNGTSGGGFGNYFPDSYYNGATTPDPAQYPVLSQVLNTAPGTSYIISFDLNDGGSPGQPFAAYFGGDTLLAGGTPDTGNVFQTFTYSRFATAASTTLSFTGSNLPGYWYLTNVSVATPAPLPILGVVAAFGWSRKLRRRIKAARAAQAATARFFSWSGCRGRSRAGPPALRRPASRGHAPGRISPADAAGSWSGRRASPDARPSGRRCPCRWRPRFLPAPGWS